MSLELELVRAYRRYLEHLAGKHNQKSHGGEGGGLSGKDRKGLKQVQANLIRIQKTGKAPISIVQYKNMGLIKVRNKTVTLSNGDKEKRFDRLVLTEKGKRLLDADL